MLALGIRYLNGFAVATEPDSHERAEWPPHPGRVFMALAAAHFQTGCDPAEREALVWLEALDTPPAIRAGGHEQRTIVTQYVPVNDKAGPAKGLLQSVPLTRDRQPRTFARAVLEEDTVYLVWPSADPSPAVRSALTQLCPKVTRIGHSSSLVQMWLADEGESIVPTWVPDDDRAIVRLRVPGPGTLDDLAQSYNGEAVQTYADLLAIADDNSDKAAQRKAKARLKADYGNGSPLRRRPRLTRYQGYARPEAVSESRVRGTVFDPHLTVLTLRREDGPYRVLDLACVLAVAQRFREAILSQSDDLPTNVRYLLSGHDVSGAPLESPHLAFVPMAFVDHPHADGHLLGIGIALPRDVSRDDRRLALCAVARVKQLKLGRLGVWSLDVQTALRPAHNLRAETWTAYDPDGSSGATVWATVTPIAYDRHPKTSDRAAYQRAVAEMIAQACIRVGLPGPRDVVVSGVSAFHGVPPAHAVPRLQRKDGSARRHAHAVLVFDEPVCGPMLIGAGRYRGYGMCRALNRRDDVARLARGVDEHRLLEQERP